MAKIAIRIPEPKEQYDFSNQNQEIGYILYFLCYK
jgi:hypothetical protein